MSKFYAKKIACDGSPLFNNADDIEWDDDSIAILGNYDLKPFVPDWISVVWDAINDLADVAADYKSYGYKSLRQAVKDRLPNYSKPLTVAELDDVADLLTRWNASEDHSHHMEIELLCDLLHYCNADRNPYVAIEIHGDVQADWNDIICPAKTTRDDIKYFEALYFNTGTKWFIMDDFDESRKPTEEAFADWMYVAYTPYAGDEEEEKRFIKKYCLGDVDCDIVLYDYDYDFEYEEEQTPNDISAHLFVEAIKALAADEDRLENLESYLSMHFDKWLARYGKTPYSLADELMAFTSHYEG